MSGIGADRIACDVAGSLQLWPGLGRAVQHQTAIVRARLWHCQRATQIDSAALWGQLSSTAASLAEGDFAGQLSVRWKTEDRDELAVTLTRRHRTRFDLYGDFIKGRFQGSWAFGTLDLRLPADADELRTIGLVSFKAELTPVIFAAAPPPVTPPCSSVARAGARSCWPG
jgi:hypothetical protein